MKSFSLITDIHAHVLPNVDDGPATIEQTQCLLNSFSKSGVDRVFCTPHYLSPHFNARSDGFEQAFFRVKNECSDMCPNLQLGAEVRICNDLLTDIKFNSVPRLGNTCYVLIEFPSTNISHRMQEIVYELKIRGLQPIMAHPERNRSIQQNPNLIDELIECGISMQLTAECFTHEPTKARPSDKLAWNILKQGSATVVASDAHDIISRPPLLVDSYDNIACRFGQQIVDALIENANAIWEGERCFVVPEARKKRLFGSKMT